jgi:hypothetical protein
LRSLLHELLVRHLLRELLVRHLRDLCLLLWLSLWGEPLLVVLLKMTMTKSSVPFSSTIAAAMPTCPLSYSGP